MAVWRPPDRTPWSGAAMAVRIACARRPAAGPTLGAPSMRLFAGLLGLFLVIAAIATFAADLAAASEGNDMQLMPLGQLWYSLHVGSLNLTQAVIERYIWEPLWDPLLTSVLQLPAGPVLGLLGILLIVASLLRRPGAKAGAGKAKRKPRGDTPKA